MFKYKYVSPNVATFRNRNGSKMVFTKKGLVKINDSVIGEFNIFQAERLKAIEGSYKVFKNGLKFKDYKLVFGKKGWKLFKSEKVFNQIKDQPIMAGRLCLTKFNLEERMKFFHL